MARHDPRVGYGLPTLLAIVLHLAILAFSVIRLPGQESEPTSRSIVQATLVRTETTTNQAQRTEDTNSGARARQEAEDKAQQEAETRRQAEEAEQQVEEAAQEMEQREAEADRARQEAEAAAAEAQRRAEEAAQQARLREQRQAEAEAQRQREAERKRQQAEAEAQRQREAERKRQQAEVEAQRQQAAEAARRAAEAASQGLERAIEGETQSVANARQAQEAANSFIILVRRAVEQAWVIPPVVPEGASAEVAVRLGPSGELFNTTITKSSGSNAFDRSVIQAVEVAAPFAELRQLPSAAQDDYRQFNLRFRPGDIR